MAHAAQYECTHVGATQTGNKTAFAIVPSVLAMVPLKMNNSRNCSNENQNGRNYKYSANLYFREPFISVTALQKFHCSLATHVLERIIHTAMLWNYFTGK